MAHDVLFTVSAPGRPVAERAAPTGAPVGTAGNTSVGRMVGVDLARGLAVLGMYAAHVGPDPSVGGFQGWLMEVAQGRSSALFAFLAGFSIVLITGRYAPATGRAGRQAVVRVVVRAVILVALGTALTLLGTSVEVILAYYGVCFLLVLPLYRLRPAVLAAIAAGSVLVLPQALFVVQRSIDQGSWAEVVTRHDLLAHVGGTDGVIGLMFTGDYPVLAWVPFLIAGMAVARLDLRSAAVRARLAMTGGALALVGYGGSWLALHLIPGVVPGISTFGVDAERGGARSAWWSDAAGFPSGDGDSASWLWAASPHSETTLSVVAGTGVALLVLVGCTDAVARGRTVRRVATPVIAVGSMSLTFYVGHILAIKALGLNLDDLPGPPMGVLLAFVAAALLPAFVWSSFFRRGPLEYALNRATLISRYVA
ncbi:heparan-alpha-glucosaminide N-acetyltransferase domain-containing protein [Streptomyces sp. NPDC002574]|uniref:heparan-alpha-glucosaminide N-acetyltransferase domain-containing protein n=1 Tax=Streptomyces sp. NPDC002574 TaxID=3364652 RepID=UPI0036C6607F